MDIDVRLIRSFVAIYEKSSLSRAADELACTQAAMSMRLKLLETELGEPLFVRNHHKLDPTFKGTEFYAKALTVLAAYDEMISATRNTAHRGKIRIGVPDDYALGFLPDVLARVAAEHHTMEIDIKCDLSANLIAALSRNEIDLALVTLASEPLGAVKSVMVDLHWVQAPGYTPGRDMPVSLVAYPEGCVFRRAMINALDSAGMPWAVLAQSRSHAGIVAALRGMIGVSVMAQGTAPSGLVEVRETEWLPKLDPVPVSLVCATGRRSEEVRLMSAAIAGEMRNFAAPQARDNLSSIGQWASG